MSEPSGSSSRGMSFVEALTIAFIVLKLIDKIDWSWGWVLSPLWISASLAIIIIAIIAIFS